MARLIGGRPRYPSEEKVLRHLQTALPDAYLLDICRKLPIGKFKEYREIDVLVIAPHAIYLLEVKNLHGAITGDRDTWKVDDGRAVNALNSPLRQADYNAQSLKTFLVEAIPEIKGLLWVQALVVLPSDRVRVAYLPQDVAERVCTLAMLVPKLQNTTFIPGGRSGRTADLLPYYPRLEIALTGRTSPLPSPSARADQRRAAPVPQPARPTPPLRQTPRTTPPQRPARRTTVARSRSRQPGLPDSARSRLLIGLVALIFLLIAWASLRWVSEIIINRSAAIDPPTPSLARSLTGIRPTVARALPAEQLSTGDIRPGSIVVVVKTSGPLIGYQEPRIGSQVVATFFEGAQLQVLEGPVVEDDYIWWKVQGDAGTGWSAAGSLDGTIWLQIVQN